MGHRPMCRSGRSNYLPARCLMAADWVTARPMIRSPDAADRKMVFQKLRLPG